jgi:hypothetical protein
MMVNPLMDRDFCDWSNGESYRPFRRQSRIMTLICPEIEANRNVSIRMAKTGGKRGR